MHAVNIRERAKCAVLKALCENYHALSLYTSCQIDMMTGINAHDGGDIVRCRADMQDLYSQLKTWM